MVWADDVWARIEQKLSWVQEKTGDAIPYTTDASGNYEDIFTRLPVMWTNGFWPGIMWLMYSATKDERYRKTAEAAEKKLDIPLFLGNGSVEILDHDVGFLWLLSALANYRITGSPDSHRRAVLAANALMARYNPHGSFLTAWNGAEREGWSIVDTMMNLPLLYWLSGETGVSRFGEVASCHADKTMQHIVRKDGSCAHIVMYNPLNGQVLGYLAGQGASDNSAWSRGQAWALHGFARCYAYTKNSAYLDTAKKVAAFFMAESEKAGYLPPCDFRGDPEMKLKDATAGAIAASGLIEIARLSQDNRYMQDAVKLLKALDEQACEWGEGNDAILQRCCERYTDKAEKTIIYGDYFFIEAILKLKGNAPSLW